MDKTGIELKLERKKINKRRISSKPKEDLVRKFSDSSIDLNLLRRLRDNKLPLISDKEALVYLEDLKEDFKQQGIEPSERNILRELACRISSSRISEISDHKKLLFDPDMHVFSEEKSGLINKYVFSGRLHNLEIDKLQDGQGPALILIDGFLTENKDGCSDWNGWRTAITKSQYKHSAVYSVRWDSGKQLEFLGKLGSLISYLGLRYGSTLAATVLGATATSASTAALPAAVYQLLKVWYDALAKAERVGQRLSYIIQCTDHADGFILMGHSLGARVSYYLLKDLAEVKKSCILEAYMLGGAVGIGNSEGEWDKLSCAMQKRGGVAGRVYNYRSANDQILKYLYQLTTVGAESPAGLSGIDSELVKDIDLSKEITGPLGHLKYRDYLKLR